MNIEKAMKKIEARRQRREQQGAVPEVVLMQSVLEITLLMAQGHMDKNPGQIISMNIDNDDERTFYFNVMEKLDLPPDICALFIPPNAWKGTPLGEMTGGAFPERTTYTIIISHFQDRQVLIQVALPDLKSIGTDVYDDGVHFADYTYNTIEECLDDLSKVTWTYFKPKQKPALNKIIQYTENWFNKSYYLYDLNTVKIHSDYSYLHHPELIGLSPLESVFKAVGADIPKEYYSLQNAIENTNDLNKNIDLGYTFVTEKGIQNNKLPECQSLFDRLIVEVDMRLEKLAYVKGIQFPKRNNKDPNYQTVFFNTVKAVYQDITGQLCPEAIVFE